MNCKEIKIGILYKFTLIFSLVSCKQAIDKTHEKHSDTTVSFSYKKVLANEKKTFIELYLEKYIDSLNYVGNETELPSFLEDSQFDYKKRGGWYSFHNPISIRAQIINRVNNCKALLLILQSSNIKYKTKPLIEDNLAPPLINLSFYDLALERFNSLKCIMKY